MKKIVSIFLCALMLLSFAGCKSDKASAAKKHDIDVEYYASHGKMPECEFSLGESIEEIKKTLDERVEGEASDEEAGHSHSEWEYTVYEENGLGLVALMGINIYYDAADEKTVSELVSFGDGFGFKSGAVSLEVRDTMTSLGFETTEREAEEGEIFFLPASEALSVLEYSFEQNTVLFVFQDNALCATLLK